MRGRWTKPNHTSRCPAAHVVVDTETLPGDTGEEGVAAHTIRLGHAISWRREGRMIRARRELAFLDGPQFWSWLCCRASSHRTTWVWAHNLGFDLSTLRFWDQWDVGRWTPELSVLEDPPTILVGRMQGRKIVLIDTLNWWPHSLAKIGGWLGVTKWPLPDFGDPDGAWADYCRNDAIIMERLVNVTVDLVQSLDLGCMRYTAASQAYAHWRHAHLTHPLCPSTGKRVCDLERSAYYGGRAEIWYRGHVATLDQMPEIVRQVTGPSPANIIEGPVCALDVSAMYSHAMSELSVPVCERGYSEGQSLDVLRRELDSCEAIARVAIQTSTDTYPVSVKGRTVYACGRYTTTLCGPELRAAVERGHVVGMAALATYDTAPALRSFADYWWHARERATDDGNEMMERFAKSMPNALYGKFGQLSPRWVREPKADGGDVRWGRLTWMRDDGTAHCIRRLAGQADVEAERVPTEHTFAAVAAWVTAGARRHMDKLREIAGPRQVLMQYVDSLQVLPAGYANLVAGGLTSPRTRGMLRLICTHDTASYYSPQLCRLSGLWHATGLPGRARQISPDEWRCMTFERLDSLVARRPDGAVRVRTGPFRPEWGWHGSSVGADGWCSPLFLNQ